MNVHFSRLLFPTLLFALSLAPVSSATKNAK